MLLGFGYLFKFAKFYFSFFSQKAGNDRLKKSLLVKILSCNITFLFLLKIGSVGPVDQQINLVWPNNNVIKNDHKLVKHFCRAYPYLPLNFNS